MEAEDVKGAKAEVFLGCIADDHTGATDIAGLLARSGVQVNLRMGVPKEHPSQADLAPFEVIALKSRNGSVRDAVAETSAALDWLKTAGARRFYWKYCSTFDSTPQGNIGPVSEALMASLGVGQTIYCPAFPENGRSVFMGNLFVNDLPLSESPMKDHPLTPMRDSNLMRLLAPQLRGQAGLANQQSVAEGVESLQLRLSELRDARIAHVIVDAVSNSDLAIIAEACHDMPFLTGGSALAMFLPALYKKAGHLPKASINQTSPVLNKSSIVLSGSCSAMTRAQVAEYLKVAAGYQLDPIEIANTGLEPARKWLAAQDIAAPKIIYATAEPEQVQAAQAALGMAKASTLIEDALAQLAYDAHQMGVRRYVIAGGETAGAITKALKVEQMTIGVEIAPGVPWTFASSNGVGIALALKSGNFGGKDFFTRALQKMDLS